MYTRVVKPGRGPEILVRSLRRGDTATVQAMFDGSARSREGHVSTARSGAWERKSRSLAMVGPRHQALVAWVDGDPEPVAMARLVRQGERAEIAFEVADSYQARGIGSALARLLVADARAAGICEITALVRSDNRAALALLRRVLGRLELRIEGPDLLVSASLPGCC
jgi:ribosomal protein S18 acetylase RimI-like enzyme